MAVVAYVAAYQLLYITWLSPAFAYMGFDYTAPSYLLVVLAWGLSILPVLWSPISLTRPSQMIYWVLYFAVFVPSMFVPMYVRLSQVTDVVELMVTMFVGFSLLSLVYVLPLPTFRHDILPAHLFWALVTSINIALSLWIVSVFHGNFHLVSFGDVYELRTDADTIMAGTKVAYALTWLAGSINPFLMARGLMYKERLLFWAGCGGELFLYSAAGNKTAILSPIMIFVLYLLLRNGVTRFATRLCWVLVLGLLSLYGVSLVLAVSDSPILFYLIAIVFMRALGSPGLFSAQYYSFFHSHPLTYLSHVTGPNLLVHYPYHQALGLEIGHYFMGVFDLNSNAHFWATDGIASFGLPGIVMVSFFCVFLFWTLDVAANGHKPVFATLALIFAAVDLANTSLFTTMFSGGMFLSILLLLFMPKESPPAAPLAA